MGEKESERKMTLKFAIAVTGRLMMLLLDTGLSRRASFVGMINSSGRDTVRHQGELPDPEGCETVKKIVVSWDSSIKERVTCPIPIHPVAWAGEAVT